MVDLAESSRPRAKISRRAIVRGVGVAALTGCAAYTLRLLRRRGPEAAPTIPQIVRDEPARRPRPSRGEQVEQIFSDSITPLLATFDRRNSASVVRAIATLHDRVSMHRAGIAPFTKDITSWRTRFGVLGRYSSGLWHKFRRQPTDRDSVSTYVNEKFRRHILSEESLRRDVSTVLAQFDDDMAASRNQLYSELYLPLNRITESHLIQYMSLDEFRDGVQRRAIQTSRSMAPDTVVSGLAALAGGWVAMDVAQGIASRVVGQIIARLGIAMAADGIEAGGATVGGSAVGGGAGSLGGPAGAVIGIGVGLVVGAIVDWWLSRKFEAKIARQCNLFLDSVEQRLRDGIAGSPGLRQALAATVAVTGQAQRESIHAALKECI